MANPLRAEVIEDRPAVGMVDRCRARNADPLARRMSRWYFVALVDGRREMSNLEGADGGFAWDMLEGKFEDFMGWPEQRMNGYRRWLSGCIERGGGNPFRAPSHAH